MPGRSFSLITMMHDHTFLLWSVAKASVTSAFRSPILVAARERLRDLLSDAQDERDGNDRQFRGIYLMCLVATPRF
jgi:hypothetical protein